MPISPPVQIAVPFATAGLKNPIPANTNNVTGNAGYDAGFGAINMTPKIAGGIPPFGQDFNGIFYDVTLALQFLEAGGSFPYSSTFATASAAIRLAPSYPEQITLGYGEIPSRATRLTRKHSAPAGSPKMPGLLR